MKGLDLIKRHGEDILTGLNLLWIIGASINMTLFYINIFQGDYLYAALSVLCALVFALNIR